MSQQPSVETVEEGGDCIHVRFRGPDQFDTVPAPDWAANAGSAERTRRP